MSVDFIVENVVLNDLKMTSYDLKRSKKILTTDLKWARKALSALQMTFLNSQARDVSSATPGTLVISHNIGI